MKNIFLWLLIALFIALILFTQSGLISLINNFAFGFLFMLFNILKKQDV
jgi:hypothetical protein